MPHLNFDLPSDEYHPSSDLEEVEHFYRYLTACLPRLTYGHETPIFQPIVMEDQEIGTCLQPPFFSTEISGYGASTSGAATETSVSASVVQSPTPDSCLSPPVCLSPYLSHRFNVTFVGLWC